MTLWITLITLLGLIKKGVLPIVRMGVISWKEVIKIKILELFGGIGACTQAFKRLNIPVEVVDYVEIDKYAVKSYNAINGTNFEPQDITKWDKDVEVDFIMHGSPCQDFSVAGLGRGGDEGSKTRSSLLYETVRIVEKLRPQYVLWENVKNVLSKKHRHNFDKYLEKMEKLGYTNYYQVLNAKDYNIPQNRERVFVLSMLNNTSFEFPTKIERTRNLSDMLEDVVDEKFYISNEKAEKLISQLTEKSKTDKKCVDGTINKPDFIDIANCIKARYDCGISNFKQDGTMVVEPVLIGGEQANQSVKTDGVSTCLTSSMGSGGGYVPMVIDKPILVGGIGEKNFGTQYRQGNRVYDSESIAMCLTSQPVGNTGGNSYLYVVNETRPCLTPDRIEKRQNGRRFKEDGEDMFTLTGQDRHGVLQVGNIVDTGNWDNPQRGRIYSVDGCSPSLNCVSGGGLEPKILEDFYTNRDIRVFDDCPTQRADRQGLKVIEVVPNERFFKQAIETLHENECKYGDTINAFNRTVNATGISPTLTTRPEGFKTAILPVDKTYRIRKLTPKECWRLMGFSDECFEKAEQVNSNSQLYKQAGNSIVVDVLVCIISQLMIAKSKWLDELLGGE